MNPSILHRTDRHPAGRLAVSVIHPLLAFVVLSLFSLPAAAEDDMIGDALASDDVSEVFAEAATTPPTTQPTTPTERIGNANAGVDGAAPSAPPVDHAFEPLVPQLSRTLGWVLGGDWRTRDGIAVRETYDDNVYLQDRTSKARIRSAVTTISPFAEIEWKPANMNARAVFNYAPDITAYHAAPQENYTRHALTANFVGNFNGLVLESNNLITLIDGSRTAPTYTGKGGSPAIGAFQVRDRRDASVYRDGIKLGYAKDAWLVRAVFNAYEHDFHTKLSAAPGYANFVNRADLNGGFDIGYKAMEKAYVLVGYRFGHQSQQAFLGNPLQYSNDYQRVLLGIEGQVMPWMKVAASAGPDFRHFGSSVAANFDRTRTEWYYDVTATFAPTKADEVVLLARQFMQPSSGGRAVSNDITYAVTYKHLFNEHWSAGVGFRAYCGDYDPTIREDWIYTPSASVVWTITPHLSAELAWSLDDAESRVSRTPGREYHRNLTTIGVKYGL